MLTEKDISTRVQRAIHSPIRVGQLADFGIAQADFLSFFRPFFEELEDDPYLVRQKQIEFLLETLPHHQQAIKALHRDYFEGQLDHHCLAPYTKELDATQQQVFERHSTITRKRSIANFIVEWDDQHFQIKQVEEGEFHQNVEDFRVWKRVFKPTDEKALASPFFQRFLEQVAHTVQQIHPEQARLHITVHFMRTLGYPQIAGENSPEGVHEDGTHYIISALVIDRQNALGGESSIYEKLDNGEQQLLYKKALAAGEFIFQADTGEEETFGNDLWHHVTAITPQDPNQVAVRDIIGLDIDLI